MLSGLIRRGLLRPREPEPVRTYGPALGTPEFRAAEVERVRSYRENLSDAERQAQRERNAAAKRAARAAARRAKLGGDGESR